MRKHINPGKFDKIYKKINTLFHRTVNTYGTKFIKYYYAFRQRYSSIAKGEKISCAMNAYIKDTKWNFYLDNNEKENNVFNQENYFLFFVTDCGSEFIHYLESDHHYEKIKAMEKIINLKMKFQKIREKEEKFFYEDNELQNFEEFNQELETKTTNLEKFAFFEKTRAEKEIYKCVDGSDGERRCSHENKYYQFINLNYCLFGANMNLLEYDIIEDFLKKMGDIETFDITNLPIEIFE